MTSLYKGAPRVGDIPRSLIVLGCWRWQRSGVYKRETLVGLVGSETRAPAAPKMIAGNVCERARASLALLTDQCGIQYYVGPDT